MNPFVGNTKEVETGRKGLRLKVLGVGSAGCRIAEHLEAEGLGGQVEVFALNADAQALNECRVEKKFSIGAKLTGGLGTGGEPERGKAAAMEDIADLETVCGGADMVFVLAGLGGGTGTGAAPLIAATAKSLGALVVAFVTTPFSCEGKRREQQAAAGQRELRNAADGMVCLPNQQVFKLINEDTSLAETFKTTNEYVAKGVGAIWRMVSESGLIDVDFADLCSLLRGREVNSSFATVESSGPNRVRDAVDRLLAHPLLDDGLALEQAEALLVSVAGSSSLSMKEVNGLMEQLGRRCGSANVKMGATVNDAMGDRLSVTVIAANGATEPCLEEEPGLAEGKGDEPVSIAAPVGAWRRRKANRMAHPELNLHSRPNNPFTESEPTMRDGEDLDIPTFVRRGMVLA
jgi:cell division protein FtsZ